MERLIRALQRGGVAAQLSRDRWGVWRGQDRRRRMIGTLPGAEVDVLLMKASLSPLGQEEPPVLIWTGDRASDEDQGHSTRALQASVLSNNLPLIELVIARCPNPDLRAQLRQTVQAFRHDMESATHGAGIPGMNWQGLALGGRIQGGRLHAKTLNSSSSARAATLVRMIENRFDQAEWGFLQRLILAEERRDALAKRYETRPPLIEQRGLASLRRLREAYTVCARG